MSFFEGNDGGRAGGVGDFNTEYPACSVRLTDSGAITIVDLLTPQWHQTWKAGLFQNDFAPDWLSRLVDVQPADFSGYSGLQNTYSWSVGVILGERAMVQSSQIAWACNGMGNQNWIYGYYVVDELGNLMWAERFCPGPKAMRFAGDTIKLKPQFTLRNEFRT